MNAENSLWLVWSMEHRLWWAPNGNGYVKSRSHAGRYSYDQAVRIVADANWSPDHDTHPSEAMILDY
jgi:hypothetical protein